MGTNLNLEKLIWNEDDFDRMGWHDCKIYAVAFKDENFELVFDIDYIVEWLHPKDSESNFKFWVSPSTLVFKNVWDLNISLESNLNLEIQDIRRENPSTPKNAKDLSLQVEYDWIIETGEGKITFKSVGYVQYLRKLPILLASQTIDFNERGGISFETGS